MSSKRAPVAASPNLEEGAGKKPVLGRMLYGRPGFLLRRAHQISLSIFEEAFSDLGITTSQFAVLAVLLADPSLDQSSVAKAVGMDKVTVSHLVRGLETRGLVVRRTDPENRRRRSLTLTQDGKDLMARIEAPHQIAYENLMSPFDSTQRELFMQLLQHLTTELEPCSRAPLVQLQR
jgi:MarR family transcriptional regulator, lower aerobic nicotinate degradation pathway regulator